jgi:hypothetical protein
MAETPDVAFESAGDSTAIPVGRFRTLREVNERNCQFWLEQSSLMEQRVADEDVLCTAVNDLQSEALRQVPAYSRKSFEGALETATDVKLRFQRHAAKSFQIAFSKKGGRTPKTDALQKLILQIVRESPDISQQQLLHKLKKDGGGVVLGIDAENDVLRGDIREIHFVGRAEREETARVSGLKDRLSRARKQINSL